jgi:protein-S-isoprenylcysteine O-methyltransferase Ste14
MGDSGFDNALVTVRAAVFATAFVLLWTWLALLVRGFDAGLPPLPGWLRPVGLVLAVGGALLGLSCIVAFAVKGRGTPAPFDPPREFVADGPYRLVRNPMYVGGVGVIAGAGLVVTSPSIVLLAAAALVAAHLFVVLYEEPALTRRFGASYLHYKASVHRWLPRLPWRRTPGQGPARRDGSPGA